MVNGGTHFIEKAGHLQLFRRQAHSRVAHRRSQNIARRLGDDISNQTILDSRLPMAAVLQRASALQYSWCRSHHPN